MRERRMANFATHRQLLQFLPTRVRRSHLFCRRQRAADILFAGGEFRFSRYMRVME